MHVYETNTIYICIKCVSIERYKRRSMHMLTCTTLYMSGSLERGRETCTLIPNYIDRTLHKGFQPIQGLSRGYIPKKNSSF